MKFLKWLFMLLGIAALIAGGAMLANVVWDMGKLMAAVRGYNTGVKDPTTRIYYVTGLAALGGLLLGWGIGLPSRTGRAVRNQYKSELAARGVAVDPEQN
ncbi:hypothetical protein ACTQ49_04750 [Luteococcus sp. Sow4_B9]|uniref:hypothetical protein n=1 Tax=Luteococcus sp. Sow4_B9 TaxID=3438792 RepID=UPI003F9E8847